MADDEDKKDGPKEASSEISQILQPGLGFGRYKIKKTLGEGGMGVVYEAHDPKLNRRLAIKLMQVSKSGSEVDTKSAKSRMLREAQAMAMVTHPNLIEVYDVGTYENNVFIAMEYVEGQTLRDWINQVDRKAQWKEILQVYVAAARGLAAAHRKQVIHRDFKPENVMIDAQGTVKVMDFGLARANQDPDSTGNALWSNTLTQSGVIVGTPAYMSPEQILGEKTEPTTDQFSFCVSLFEALYGYRPFPGNNVIDMAKCVLKGQIQLPGKNHPVPGFILDALLTGLQTNPEERHDSMDNLIEELVKEAPQHSRPWLLYAVTAAIAGSGLILYFVSLEALEQQRQEEVNRTTPVLPSPEPEPEPTGVLTTQQMMETIGRQKDDLRACLVRGFADAPGLEGSIPLEFTLDATGQVEEARVVSPRFPNESVARCLVGKAIQWTFPTPSEAGQVTYDLALSQEVLFPIVIPPDPPEGGYKGKGSAPKMRKALREEKRPISKCLEMGPVPEKGILDVWVDAEGNGLYLGIKDAHRAVNWCLGEIADEIEFPKPSKGAIQWSTPISRIK